MAVDSMIDIDPEKSLLVMHECGAMYARAKAERVYMEALAKTIKAQLMKDAEIEGHNSVAAQEREAYADAKYKQHLLALKEAVQAEEALRWKLVSAQAAVEVWRSTEASNRAMDRGTR